MELFNSLRHKKNGAVALTEEQEKLLNDSSKILEILKKCGHYSAIEFDELRYHLRRGGFNGTDEEIADTLMFLSRNGILSWGGRNCSIGFEKHRLPESLQILKF